MEEGAGIRNLIKKENELWGKVKKMGFKETICLVVSL